MDFEVGRLRRWILKLFKVGTSDAIDGYWLLIMLLQYKS